VNPEARWEAPPEYGYAAAIEGMGSVAAPLLGGFSFALAVFLIESKDSSFWTTVALLLFLTAAFAFVSTVQFTFRARQFAVTPPEIEMWYRNPDDPIVRERLRREQRYYVANHRAWATRAAWAYDAGLLSLLLGVATAFVPSEGLGDASGGRVTVIALAFLGFAVEFTWIARTRRSRKINLADWPPAPGPESVW
jgi:hypothetical protein